MGNVTERLWWFTNVCSIMSYHPNTTLKRSEAINGYHQ
jgi:hypothetical protein